MTSSRPESAIRYFSKSSSFRLPVKKKLHRSTPKQRPAQVHTPNTQAIQGPIQPSTIPQATIPSPPVTLSEFRAQASDHQSYAQQLATRPSPTLLYQASSHFPYLFGCYSGALALMGAGFFNYLTAVGNAPIGPNWYLVLLTTTGIGFAGLGVYMGLRPQRLIKRIIAMPVKEGARPQIKFRIEASPVIPFQKAKVIEVHVGDVSKNIRLLESIPKPPMTPQEARAAAKTERDWQMSHLLTLPFRQMSRLLFRGFHGFKSALTEDGLARVIVKDKGTWKLDMKNGWSLDDGRGMLYASL